MATNNSTNSPFPLSAAQGGLGVASPTAHGILIAEGASAATPIVLAAGQILIGTTSSDPTAAALTAGTGISITSVTGSSTITNTAASGLAWTSVAASTQAMVANNGYYTNNGSTLVTYTLPSTAAAGTVLAVSGFSTGGWTIHQNASQLINLGNVVTTTGTGGSLASTNTFDCVYLLCVTANTEWVVQNSVGNITYV